MAGSTSRTHTIICWKCFFPFEVKLALPKNAKRQGRVYNPWKSTRKCTTCNSKTVLKLSYTEKTGVYVDYEEPVEELDDTDGKDLAPIDQIGTYFSRNYREGERLKIPKGTAKGWIGWKNSKLRRIGFYDKKNNRTKSIDDEPARIRLREDSDLSDGHFEFKSWIQDKVEQAAAGESSPKFLSKEDRNEEREEALEAWMAIRREIEKIIDERIIETSNGVEGRQLSVIRKISGRLEPSMRDFQLDAGFHGSIGLEDWWKMEGRMNLVEKIANEVARCLISHSANSIAEDGEIFRWRSGVNDGNDLFEFARDNGCFISAKKAKAEFKSGFVNKKTGEIDSDRINLHRERMGANLSDLYKRRQIRMIISKLIEEEISPKREWMWMYVWTAGIQFFPDVRNRVRRHIENEGEKALKIFDDKMMRKEAGLIDGKHALSESEKRDLERFRKKGFGNTQGADKSRDEWNEDNSLAFVYNIVNEMKRAGFLSPARMTQAQYTSYFLDGDDSLTRGRGVKQYPNNLVFSKRLLRIIGKSRMEDFEIGQQNAIYRWLRGDRDRWMYCPPNKHEWLGGEITEGGLLRDSKISSNTSDYETFEVEKRDLGTGEVVEGKEGPIMVKTVKCEPGIDVMRAMNSLQETQWEVNLDLLEKICHFELDEGANLDGRLVNKKSRIKRIVPNQHFLPAFFDEKGDNADEERRTVLEWCRRIIEHNGNVFWHSWMCDFRGRMVPRCQLLSPQKGDLSRALLRFKHWKPLGEKGRFWIHVHVHNLMEGVEVLSEPDSEGNRVSMWEKGPASKNQKFERRDEWVMENLDLLREMGREPERYLVELGLDERRYSKRSDFQRLSALIELDRLWGVFDHSGEDWGSIKSGQPVYLDASCNGYQHVSSLLRDKKLARLTNVIESKKGPLDLYTEVANEAKKLGRVTIEEKLNEIGLRKGLIEECLDKIFTRSLAKQPTIVRVYGSSDMLKCLEGRKGQGKPEFSMPRPRELNDKEKEERKEITGEFEEAYFEYLEARRLGENIPMSYYQKHAKKIRGSGFSKDRAKKWSNLLREEVSLNLWASGSGLHEAIIANGGELGESFAYPEGDLWEHQHDLSVLMRDIMLEAIGNATRNAYGKLEESLSAVTKSCGAPALWPGVYWDVMPGEEGGFRVHQYYINRQGSDISKRGKPTHLGAVYSGLLPEWYKKNEWAGHKGPKSNARIAIRICELYGKSEGIAPEARRFLRNTRDAILTKGKRFYFQSPRFEMIIEQAEGDKKSEDGEEILGLMRQREYSIPNYSKVEKERTKGRKNKVNSSMAPNFVHSLDAYHMRTSINRMKSVMSEKEDDLSFWAVHDAFGTHACDIDLMRKIVKDCFFEMHQSRNLNDWTDEMKWVGKEKTSKVRIGSLWKDTGKTEKTSGDYLIS